MAVTGLWALRLLLAALAIGPAARGLRQGWLLRCRRAVGLAAFAYAVLHAVIFAIRTQLWLTPLSLVLMPYLATGTIGLLMLLPLAATSFDAAVRRLGEAWRRLHRLIYLAAPLAVVHLVLINPELSDQLIYGGATAVLLASRIQFRKPGARPA